MSVVLNRGEAPGRDSARRLDAWSKAVGATRYSADLEIEGALHGVVVRSHVAHAEITRISTTEATAVAGVVAVVTATDLATGLCGRRVRDMPLLAADEVRFTGENVAVVLAETRRAAEEAAALVDVDYRELPAVFDADEALSLSAPSVHQAPWTYDGAVVSDGDPVNLQSELVDGSPAAVDEALARASHVVARTYRTPAGHQGYLEPHCWTAAPAAGGGVRLQGTTKSPYRLREQVAKTLGLAVGDVTVAPVPLGGDVGGKGDVVDPALCAARALGAGRPVRLAFRSGEDFSSTDARHPARIDVRLGCDERGGLMALSVDAVLDGGAYAAAKPVPSVNLHGLAEAALGYRLGCFAIRSRIAYTHTVPKGHMRAPGAPQAVFAVESALDELATAAGIDPVELRRRNLLNCGDRDAYGHTWPQARGAAVLGAARGVRATVAAPAGWTRGAGCAVYARPTAPPA
ncbi:MAG: xanthine dehydrogenase family protein molybdopterin-binding subunit, partial [Actinomycetes bacterium]